ncbi:MAG: hypothetical protein HQM14_10185 [SAR324 cluster bacterium]|nr:hypothetical protein [SAR324 cluster bacterium]
MIQNIFRTLTLAGIYLFFSFAIASAQFSTFDDDFLSGFSEDGRIKVLLLKLAPVGAITETSAEEFVKAIQRNLSNTNHFTVVGPQELSAHLQDDPNLADCHDIACGIQIGKQFTADKVMVSTLRAESILNENAEEVPGFLLSIRLLDVLTNTMDLSDEVQFTDDTMQDELFALAARISQNTRIRGHVLSVDSKSVVIDLGRAHGLKIGDRIVIYTQSSTTNLEGDTLGLEQKNIAVAEISRLNDLSADALLLYRYANPEVGDFFRTYLNRQKQVMFVTNVRRELDTRKRLTRRPLPVDLEPEVIDDITGEPVDRGKQQWRLRMSQAISEKNRWMFIGIGAGIGTVVLLSKKIDLGKNFHQIAVIGAGAATGYAGYRFFESRNEVNALQAEGRVKKYMSSFDYQFRISPQGWNVAMAYKF